MAQTAVNQISPAVKEVLCLLESWELPELRHTFEEQEISIRALKYLKDDDIRELIPKIGPRTIFKHYLQQWRRKEQHTIAQNTKYKNLQHSIEQNDTHYVNPNSELQSQLINVSTTDSNSSYIIPNETASQARHLASNYEICESFKSDDSAYNSRNAICNEIIKVEPSIQQSDTNCATDSERNFEENMNGDIRESVDTDEDFAAISSDCEDTRMSNVSSERRLKYNVDHNVISKDSLLQYVPYDGERLIVKDLLLNNADGLAAVEFYRENQALNYKSRKDIVFVLVRAVFERRVKKTKKVFQDMAKQLIEMFPNEKYETYFTPNGGALYNKLANHIRYLRNLGVALPYKRRNFGYVKKVQRSNEQTSYYN